MLCRVIIVFICLALLRAPAWADPGDVIGATVTVVNQVTGEFNKSVRTLATGDDVVQEEIIAVGSDSIGEIMLRDETKVALGPGARLVLNRFVYDPNRTSGAIALDLIKGGFRFITGVAAKPLYLIRTPTAVVTVRGTIFDVYIEEQGAIWFLLHEGGIRVCNARDQCRDLDDPCRLLRLGPGGDLDDPGTWNALPTTREVSFEKAFPFVVKPPVVDPTPIFSRDDIVLGRCPEVKVRKAKLTEPEEPTPRRKAHAVQPRHRYVYSAKRHRRYARPRSYPPSIGISIGIGIGGGGRGGGGGHHY
jgi:hypothetical protein